MITTILFGDHHDGINVYARRLIELGRPARSHGPVHDVADQRWRSAIRDVVHVHCSDRLVEESGTQWADLVAVVRRRRVPLVVTIHDVPQPEEGVARWTRRSESVRRITYCADLVLVSSRSEQRSARDIGIDATVVDHPIFPAPSTPEATGPDPRLRSVPTLTVAGFVHPGKGIAEMLDAVGDLRGSAVEGWQLRLVGAVTDRHADEPARLEELARANGLDFHHTGSVSTREWSRELRSATVALCPHLHCSASGSILSWIAHGRRPIVTDLPFSRELADERPHALTIVGDPHEWSSSILAAAEGADRDRRRPDRSWRVPSASIAQLDAAISGLFAQNGRMATGRSA